MAIVCAALVAVNPLFVWYSQEARAYGLFVLMGALAMLCFLRAQYRPTRGRMATFAFIGALALLTHYFAVFLLIPMSLLLAWEPRTRRAALPAIGALMLVGAALLPLISAQGGHGTQWIGRWPLSERLEAIPQYYLTGYSGAPLGHGVELLVALPIFAGLVVGCLRLRGNAAERAGGPWRQRYSIAQYGEMMAARIPLEIAACGILIPVVLVAFGADYLAPRNLVAAMIPVTVVIAVVVMWAGKIDRSVSVVAVGLVVTIALAFLAISLDVDLSPRLQRGNWRDVAKALRGAPHERTITTVELGSAPLEYYLPGLHNLRAGSSVLVSEIDETGYAPLRASAGEPPAPGFRLLTHLDIDGLIVYRFVSPVARLVTEATLRRHVITLASPDVLVPAGSQVSS